jgi:hypothetical protein
LATGSGKPWRRTSRTSKLVAADLHDQEWAVSTRLSAASAVLGNAITKARERTNPRIAAERER